MVVLGLGSSDPCALSWLRRAVAAVKRLPGVRIEKISSIYRSDAMLPAGAPESWRVPYLNLAIKVVPIRGQNAAIWDDPLIFLDSIKKIESELGRQDRERWAPREIDIDLLCWAEKIFTSERLTIPHAGLLDRPFALLPLAEIWPDWFYPCPGPMLNALATALALPWQIAPEGQVPFGTIRTLLRLTELVGILNATPDSFSDGGTYSFGRQAKDLLTAGATVLDLGAESTRPGASSVGLELEWERLMPALCAILEIKRASGPPSFSLSLDSRNPAVVTRALALCIVEGVKLDWINDVEGFESVQMRQLAAEFSGDVVFMHSYGVPPEAQRVLAKSVDPVEAVMEWACGRISELKAAGVPSSRMIFDPGVGFGKTAAQNLILLRRAREFHELGVRVLIGHSRKAFLEPSRKVAASERDLETAIATASLADMGVEYLRVHEPFIQARALRFSAAWQSVVSLIPDKF